MWNQNNARPNLPFADFVPGSQVPNLQEQMHQAFQFNPMRTPYMGGWHSQPPMHVPQNEPYLSGHFPGHHSLPRMTQEVQSVPGQGQPIAQPYNPPNSGITPMVMDTDPGYNTGAQYGYNSGNFGPMGDQGLGPPGTEDVGQNYAVSSANLHLLPGYQNSQTSSFSETYSSHTALGSNSATRLPDVCNQVCQRFDEIISECQPMTGVVVDVARLSPSHTKYAGVPDKSRSNHHQSPYKASCEKKFDSDKERKDTHYRQKRKHRIGAGECSSSKARKPHSDLVPNKSQADQRRSSVGPSSTHKSQADQRSSSIGSRDTQKPQADQRRSSIGSSSTHKSHADQRRLSDSPRDTHKNNRRRTFKGSDKDDKNHRSLNLRSYSPPPPDSKRKVKFIVPEDCYTRVKGTPSQSTVTGTKKLENLYAAFEEKILQLKSSPVDMLPGHDDPAAVHSDSDKSDFESVTDFCDVFSADELSCNSDLDDKGDDESMSSDDEKHSTGPSPPQVKERKLNDPRRLHKDLWFNEKGETNEGPVCRCSVKEKMTGIRHAVYPGEMEIPRCDLLGNNSSNLHHYWVTVTPHANFMTDRPTIIQHKGREFVFEGFSLLSHHRLNKVPPCSLIRYNIEYEIHFIEQPVPKNFCIKGLDLFSDFLFDKVLELHDWALKADNQCPRFHFLPRFVFRRSEKEHGFEVDELLSMDKVLAHLMDSYKPLIQPTDLNLPANKHIELSKSCRNQIVTRPCMKPAAFRVDHIEFSSADDTRTSGRYPYIIHHGIRPVQMSYVGNPKYQKLWKSYVKLRNTLANRPSGASREEQNQLVHMKSRLQMLKVNSSMRRDFRARLNSQGVMATGIHSDVCQHAMLLPVLVHHIRYHTCLRTLDAKLGYTFKDRMLLQLALSHPSYHLNYGMNPDHARNSLSNCGVKQPRYGDRRIHNVHSKKKGITHLVRVMANLGKVEEDRSMFEDNNGKLALIKHPGAKDKRRRQTVHSSGKAWIRHNERLEFLGDAVLEFICSKHLFYMLPDMDEGHLATFRSALVQNRHLALLAKMLDLSDYMQFSHGPDLCQEDDLNHAMANCLEALLGAVYLEAGLQVATELFSRLAFTEQDLYDKWMELPKHRLQDQKPGGDRHLIGSSPVLQKLVEFEEGSGIPFTHIRLLARAFTHPQVGKNNLTLGDNQRLEFLGDSVLQFVVSVFLYQHFPDHHEGHLTLLRSSLVNSRSQAEIARQLNLQEFINTGPTGVKNVREKMLADVLEALIAAVFVDKGLRHVEVFCRVCFFSRLEDSIVNQEWIDSKSQLQQCCLAMRTEGKSPDLPIYRILQDAGPAHHKKYQVGVYFQGTRCGKGEGSSIHQAEMAAAKDALESRYFPEHARQKHLLDRKYKDKRASHPSPRRDDTSANHHGFRRAPDGCRRRDGNAPFQDNTRTSVESPRRCNTLTDSPLRARSGSHRMTSDSRRSSAEDFHRGSSSSRKSKDRDLSDPEDGWVDIDLSEMHSDASRD
ncbi:ribonuclease 3 isoform X3 [Nematostella vectensis]|uniref:ribonuclease 3 isoform X3 n=1 Tax=Nematostella vectensis TaxID=45351 RepID=UPI0020770F6E|nr:ribonuclease 3 isoform X3 [Nematostella vectensis]